MLSEKTYPIPPRGYATSFTESELPVNFALKFRNRFINGAGGAEKRQGMTQLGGDTPDVNSNGHELVQPDGTAILLTSGNGKIHKYDSDAGTWSTVYTGWDSDAKIYSVQMDEKLIFSNGVDRNIYTTDGETFKELKALIEVGGGTTGTTKTALVDSDVSSWVGDTYIALNDILYNATLDAYGIITAIVSGSVSHTEISSSAAGIGVASRDQGSGDRYQILDSVELNVVSAADGFDNVGTLAADSSATGIYLSAVPDWTKTDVRAGDWIHNTTQGALTQVTAVTTAALRVDGVSGQTTGDSITLHKSAQPIATKQHVHFGRLYSIDSRDKTKIRISGPGNPEDMTAAAGTLDSTTFRMGDLQPQGDVAVTMASYQRFFVIAGKQNIYLFQGRDPIVDVSSATQTQESSQIDFNIVGLFPHGVVSPESLVGTGNEAVFLTGDGMQSISMVSDASTLGRANLSEQIKTTLRARIAENAEADLQVHHYPRRSWIMVKSGDQLDIFNYTAFFGRETQTGAASRISTGEGSWSLFDGKLARASFYLVRADRTLVLGGPGNKVWLFDNDTYDDDGETYRTEVQPGWLHMREPKPPSVRRTQLHYIKPLFDTGANITYSIKAEGGFAAESIDQIDVPSSGAAPAPIGQYVIGSNTIGGSSIQDRKHPLRTRGEQHRITITTNDQQGPDTISRFTLYYTMHGMK